MIVLMFGMFLFHSAPGERVLPIVMDVETAVEVREPPPPDITQLCRETFDKTADYITGELEGKGSSRKHGEHAGGWWSSHHVSQS